MSIINSVSNGLDNMSQDSITHVSHVATLVGVASYITNVNGILTSISLSIAIILGIWRLLKEFKDHPNKSE